MRCLMGSALCLMGWAHCCTTRSGVLVLFSCGSGWWWLSTERNTPTGRCSSRWCAASASPSSASSWPPSCRMVTSSALACYCSVLQWRIGS